MLAHGAFSERRYEIHQVIAEGDTVVIHCTFHARHTGQFLLVDSAGVVRYRLATALPTGSFDGPTLQAAIDRL